MKRKNGEGDMLSPVSEHAVMPLYQIHMIQQQSVKQMRELEIGPRICENLFDEIVQFNGKSTWSNRWC